MTSRSPLANQALATISVQRGICKPCQYVLQYSTCTQPKLTNKPQFCMRLSVLAVGPDPCACFIFPAHFLGMALLIVQTINNQLWHQVMAFSPQFWHRLWPFPHSFSTGYGTFFQAGHFLFQGCVFYGHILNRTRDIYPGINYPENNLCKLCTTVIPVPGTYVSFIRLSNPYRKLL